MASELPLEVHPDALSELERAKAWYDGQRSGLGSRSSRKSPLPSPEYEKPRNFAGVSARHETLPSASLPFRGYL